MRSVALLLSLCGVADATLLAVINDEFVQTRNWLPATGCSACSSTESCCKDPPGGQTTPVCMNVTSCDQVKDQDITIQMRLVAFAGLDSNTTTLLTAKPLPLALHSGCTTQPVVVKDDIVMHVVNGTTPMLVRYSLGKDGTPALAASCVLPTQLVALFANSKGSLFGVPFSGGAQVFSFESPQGWSAAAGCVHTKLGALPTPIYANWTEPDTNITLPNPPVYTTNGDTLYYGAKDNLLGIDLGTTPLRAALNQSVQPAPEELTIFPASASQLVMGGGLGCGQGQQYRCFVLLDVSSTRIKTQSVAAPSPGGAGVLWTAAPTQGRLYYGTHPPTHRALSVAASTYDGTLLFHNTGLSDVCAPGAYMCETQFYTWAA